MAVRIRLKKMGRAHRPYFRVCAMDKRTPRDGRALEELGTYDPAVLDTDARAVLNRERVDYWLSVGAQPSEKVAVLIKKYGTNGTHVEQQEAALERMSAPKSVPDPGAPASLPKKPEEKQPEAGQPADEKSAEKAEQASQEGSESSSTDQQNESPSDQDQTEETAKTEG